MAAKKIIPDPDPIAPFGPARSVEADGGGLSATRNPHAAPSSARYQPLPAHDDTLVAPSLTGAFVEEAKVWVSDNQLPAMLGAFAIGVFLGVMMRG